MTTVSQKDRDVLREIAYRKQVLATNSDNDRIVKMWRNEAAGKHDAPTVRLLFSNFVNEVITPRMRCEGKTARELEASLLWSLVGRELFEDDTPLAPEFPVALKMYVEPYPGKQQKTRVPGSNAFHIDPITDSIEEHPEFFFGGTFGCDVDGTKEFAACADEVFGDILPAKIVMDNLPGTLTSGIVMLMGMQNFYMSMYDEPELLHRVLDRATSTYEKFYDYLEENHLLLPTNGFGPLSQESFAFTDELPTENAQKTTDVWGFMESQETTAVSAEMFGEFVFPYQDRLARRFGLLTYGCCERVDAIYPDYLSKWKNLRKLSVSPFNNERLVGEYLRGTRTVYYSKPRAEIVTDPAGMDDEAVRRCFREIAECASGCLFEVAQREVGTIFGDFERGKRYVRLAKETIEKYWKP